MINIYLRATEKGYKMNQKLMRYKENPFITDLNISTKSKRVNISSSIGKNENVLINQNTGEVQGTHITTYRQVDDKEFVKLFVGNIALTLDLTAAGIKAFNVLMYMVQYKAIQKDLVTLDKYSLETFLSSKNDIKIFTKKTFERGLKELVTAKIIARCEKAGDFFINPSFVFNGDRIAFTKVIERKRTEQKENHQTEIDSKN
jgi:hypothetical protein